MYKHNPKLEGSNIIDCVPQKGPCPNNCNQCFYNRVEVCPKCNGSGFEDIPYDYDIGGAKSYMCVHCNGKGKIPAFYSGLEPNIPSPEEVGDKIVRMNCGHDSNIQKDLVIKTAKKYKHFFFNTSIPNFDFPGPVVFTANPKEEEFTYVPIRFVGGCLAGKIRLISNESYSSIGNLMFVRLRVSASNLVTIEDAVRAWVRCDIPIVLTYMAYYEEEILDNNVISKIGSLAKSEFGAADREKYYVWKVRHINSYWCPTKEFMSYVLRRMKKIGGRLVTTCGSLDSNWCKDCRNCEIFYWQTIKHMKENN